MSSNIWVIGSGGLLGSSVTKTLTNTFQATPIRWSNNHDSTENLDANLEQFAQQLTSHESWQIIWAAGHATVSSSQAQCDHELEVFENFTQKVQEKLTSPGRFFLASSAGGVYAGSVEPPFAAGSVPIPTTAYGSLKLNQELALTEGFSQSVHVTTVIGRISNLYGPGQNLSKLQGLISHLILAALAKKTMNIFVPLDTIRDFVFVNDAAHVINILTTMEFPPEIAVIASGEPKSLATVISQVQGVIRTKIPIAYGEHASSSAQVADLRMIPTIPCDQLTPFPAGVKTMQLDLAQRLQEMTVFPTTTD